MKYRSAVIQLSVAVAVALVLILQSLACRRSAPSPGGPIASPLPAASGVSGELLVYVPCGVAGPYNEIIELFEKAYPSVRVKTPVITNIDVQTREIADGKASPDVWLALGDREIERVRAQGRLDGEPVTYAYNAIALMVAKQNPCKIMSPGDLTKEAVKTIALPNDENSSGYYAEKAFKAAGVWDGVQSKLWRTTQPSQVKTQLLDGKADVAVVYYPCVFENTEPGGEPKEPSGKVQLLGRVNEDLTGKIAAQAAVIKGCQNPAAGRAFAEFLLTEEAQQIWEKWKFERAVEPKTASGRRVELYMYCGSGIRPFTDKAVEAYKEIKPDVRIDVGYAGSGCLLSQLVFAERGDLYMPGEEFYIKQARDKGAIKEENLIGHFEPVIVVQKGNPAGIGGLADLTRPGLKVGIGNPEVCAVGIAAVGILDKAGIREQVKKNVALEAANVPEIANAVQLKSIDAGIVWNVTAAQVTDDCDTVAIDRAYWEPYEIHLGVLTYTKEEAEAKAFMEFCAGPEGQALVKEAGMTPAAEGSTESSAGGG